jgi:uncharacterized protein (UPF0261 family)
MIQLGHIFSERLNMAKGPVVIAVPTRGLSIPNVPDGPFWNPEADADFLKTIKKEIREDIPVKSYDYHVNDAEFGRIVAQLFINMVGSSSH